MKRLCITLTVVLFGLLSSAAWADTLIMPFGGPDWSSVAITGGTAVLSDCTATNLTATNADITTLTVTTGTVSTLTATEGNFTNLTVSTDARLPNLTSNAPIIGGGSSPISDCGQGTANQLFMSNGGATAPSWSSTLTVTAVTATNLTVTSEAVTSLTATVAEATALTASTNFYLPSHTLNAPIVSGGASASVANCGQGTANQLFMSNGGATAPSWSSTLTVTAVTATNLTGTTTNAGTLTGTTLDMANNTVIGTIPIIFGAPTSASDSDGFTTTQNLAYYGQVQLNANEDQATNYGEVRLRVPFDIDTTADLSIDLGVILLADETANYTHEYIISMACIADGEPYTTPATSDPVYLTFTCDDPSTYSAVDSVQFVNTTLTGWKDSLTAGQQWVVRIARDSDEHPSVVDVMTAPSMLRYGITR